MAARRDVSVHPYAKCTRVGVVWDTHLWFGFKTAGWHLGRSLRLPRSKPGCP
jgi:hypothetical protein